MNTDTTPFLQSPSSVPSSDNQKADFQVLTTVFYYCFTIIVMPVLTFFSCKYILFDGVLGVDSVSSNVYSAIAAIIVVHIALAMFIIRAYTDSSPVKPLKFDEKLDWKSTKTYMKLVKKYMLGINVYRILSFSLKCKYRVFYESIG